MSNITVFIGVIGSGKDYRADELSKQGHVRIDFKDELLDMASDISGYDVRQNYNWFKSHIVGIHPSSNPLSDAFINSEQKELLTKYPDLITGRKLLQRLGTEAMRSRDQDYWANQFIKKALSVIDQGGKVVNADCRFMNEYYAIRKIDPESQFVFCNYKSSRYDAKFDHGSEKLAQTFLRLNLVDGDELHPEYFETASQIIARSEQEKLLSEANLVVEKK